MGNQVSQVDAVIDALIAALTTAGLYVLDGSDDPTGDRPAIWAAVIVGGDGDPLGVGRPAAVSNQTLATTDLGSMDELGGITCAVVAQSGDDDLSGRRSESLTLLGEVESALRNDSTLGGLIADGFIEGVQTYQARARGSFVRRVFTYRFTVYQDIP
jgi:hypothetical protein